MVGHVFEKRMEEHDGHVSIFTVPSKVRQPLLKRVRLQQVLVVDEVMVSGDSLSGDPIRIFFAFCHRPAGRHGLLCTLGSLMSHSSNEA